MERLRGTFVQLEEAKRLIPDGDVARLRLALILLDNAFEVDRKLFDRGTVEDEIERLETALQDIVDAISAAGEVASNIARGASPF